MVWSRLIYTVRRDRAADARSENLPNILAPTGVRQGRRRVFRCGVATSERRSVKRGRNIMTTRARIRPSRENKRAKTRRGPAGTRGGEEQDVSAGRFPKAPGRKPALTHEASVQAHIRA